MSITFPLVNQILKIC